MATAIIIFIISTGFLPSILSLASLSVLLLACFIKEKKILIPRNNSFILLVLFALSFCVMSLLNFSRVNMFITLGLLLAYMCGSLLVHEKTENIAKKNFVVKIVIIIAFGFALHGLLNFFSNIQFGFSFRNTIDIWANEPSSATLQGTLFTLLLSLLYYFMVYYKRKLIKILYFISVTLSIIYLFLIGTRTTLIIFIATFLILFIYDGFHSNHFEKIFKILPIILSILVVFFIGYANNILGIKTNIENSILYTRLVDEKDDTSKSDEQRLSAQFNGLVSLIEHPFGYSGKIGELDYAHNMWLDVGRTVGVIPFLLLAVYSLASFKNMLFIMKSKRAGSGLKILLLGVYVAAFLNMLVEPILDGVPLFFLMFVFINGMVDEYSYTLRCSISSLSKQGTPGMARLNKQDDIAT